MVQLTYVMTLREQMINCPSCWQNFFRISWPIHDCAISLNSLNKALDKYNATYHPMSSSHEVQIRFDDESDYYLFLLKFS